MFDEFNRQAGDAPSPEQVRWEGWTPPWMSDEEWGPRGPFGRRRFGGHRGWRPWRGPFGPGFGFGFGHGPGRHWGPPEELLALRAEAMEVAHLFAIASRGAIENKERLAQLRAFLDRSRAELSGMIYGSTQSQATSEGASGSPEVGQA